MQIEKIINRSANQLPIIAALPFSISFDESVAEIGDYNPQQQLTRFAGRGYSTCRYEESVGIFNSRSDTQKDD